MRNNTDMKTENKIDSEEEINLYACWKLLLERRKIFFVIFLCPVLIAAVISISLPRYYRGEGTIYYPVIPIWPVAIAEAEAPAPYFIKIIGEIDEAKRSAIFTKNPQAINRVSITLPKKSNDKLLIFIDAKTADIIPQAYNDMFHYISNLPEIKGETERIKREVDLKEKNLTEARKANQVFLNQVTDMMKNKQIPHISVSLADLIKADVDLSLEIKKLHDAGRKFSTQSPLSISVQPTDSHLKMMIVSTAVLSLAAAIFVVFFFVDFIEHIRRSGNKQKS